MPPLPKHGVELVVKNTRSSLLDLDRFNAAVGNVTTQAQQRAKGVSEGFSDLTKRTQALGKQARQVAADTKPMNNALDLVQRKLANISPAASNAVGGITQVFGAISLGAVAAVAAATAVGASFVALGNRGASLSSFAVGFDRITASVGILSKTMLEDLRKASAGTIADFELIKITNRALIGETGRLGQELGRNLPRLLEIARVQANATGQATNEVFQNLLEGIKRGTPRLIASTGIVINATEAQRAYAEQIGKTAASLTEEEKQLAVLNATLSRGGEVIASVTGVLEGADEKIARFQASMTNIFDTLAISIQPAFEAVLDVFNNALSGVQNFVTKAAPFINAFARIIGEVAAFVGRVLFSENGIFTRLGSEGAGAFKSWAQSIATIAARFVFPVINFIAQGIADLLIGLSPPPKGPLSKIDEGGRNVMLAWLDGITGVSLEPVTRVAAQVSEALGAIGKATLPQVERRLGELDTALLPFQNRLAIVKSQFDAIAEPAKAALEAIERQLLDAEVALARGDASAAERIRQLDAQREAIQSNLDVQQRLVDQQQIQLGLAQSGQAQERALLNIRLAQLNTTRKIAAVSEKVAKAPAEKIEKALKGKGEAGDITGTGAALPSFELPDTSVLDDLTLTPEKAAEFLTDLFGEQNINDLLVQQTKLQTTLGRIAEVDVGARLADRFSGLADIFDPNKEGSVANKIKSSVESLFGGAEVEGSIANFVASLPDKIKTVKDSIQTRIESFIGGIFDPDVAGSPAAVIKGQLETLTGDSTVEGSIASFFARIPDGISNALVDLEALVLGIFDPVKDFLTGSEPGQLGAIIGLAIGFFGEIPTLLEGALRTLGLTVYTSLVLPVIDGLNGLIGLIEDGLKRLMNSSLDLAENIIGILGFAAPAALTDAVASLKGAVAGLTIPRISREIPSGLQGAAAGGLFGAGALKVGERGTEIVQSASKMAVFPHQFVSALQDLTMVLAQPAPMMIPAGNVYNNSNSIQANFYGQQDSAGVMRRLSLLQARGR